MGVYTITTRRYSNFELGCISAVLLTATALYIKLRRHKQKKCYLTKDEIKTNEPYTGHELPLMKKTSPMFEGWLKLKILKWVLNSRFCEMFCRMVVRRGEFNLIMDHHIPDSPTMQPLVKGDSEIYQRKVFTDEEVWNLIETESKTSDFKFRSISACIDGYRNGRFTPLQVAEKILTILNGKLDKRFNTMVEFHENLILKAAQESTERWRAGKPLSVFDGVPVAFKDQFFVAGYHCRNGTECSIFNDIKTESDEDGMIKKLREGGAVFIGATNITQCANSVTGINVSRYHGTPLNPYNNEYTVGGSSGGSAAAVALGLCPVALGSDAGGSIRTPAAYCGVVGLKATYSCFTTKGMLINSATVGHSGPLCSSVRDAAICYGFLADKDPRNGRLPPVNLDHFDETFENLKIGFDDECFQSLHFEIGIKSRAALELIENESNIDLVEIHIPEKQDSYSAYVCTTSLEMAAGNDMLFNLCGKELDVYTTFFFNVGRQLSFNHYFQAAKQKTRCIKALTYLFSQVDVIVLPVVSMPILKVNESRMKYGCIDIDHLGNVIRNVFLGNFTGVPCISIPIGYSYYNLPIGLQIMAPWWREDLLLRAASQLERLFQKKKPPFYFDILDVNNQNIIQ